MRRTLLALALFATACTAASPQAVESPPARATPTPAATATPTPTPVPGPDDSGFDVERAMAHVRVLSVDIGRREAGSNGDERAVAYMVERLDAMSLDARAHPFPLPQGWQSSNVVGTPAGTDVERDRYLIVGGHHDSLRGPGANDNASGVAAALEIVRVLAASPAALPVVFVAFGAEESQPAPGNPHHVGSVHFVERMSAPARANLVAMINIDMVGHGDTITLGHLDVGPDDATDRIVALARDLGIAVRKLETPDWSDNGPFLKAGLAAAWLWTGDRPEKHTPGDDISTVRAADLERTGRLALATLRSYR